MNSTTTFNFSGTITGVSKETLENAFAGFVKKDLCFCDGSIDVKEDENNLNFKGKITGGVLNISDADIPRMLRNLQEGKVGIQLISFEQFEGPAS